MNRTEIEKRYASGIAALRRATAPPPRLSRWAWAADAILALALAVGTIDGALNREGGSDALTAPSIPATPAGLPEAPSAGVGPVLHYGAVHPWQLVLAALTALPLVTRRRYPLAAFWVVIGANILYHLSSGFDPTFTFTACVIAAYSAAMYSPYQVLAIASALVGTGVIVGGHASNVPDIKPGLIAFLFLIPIGLAANMIHTWRQRVQTLEAEQAAATQLAVDQERSRIARELHDVVTHNISVMMAQAGAARMVMDVAPEKAQAALLAVEAGGRTAMTELRHVMGLLTMNSDDPDQAADTELTPPPGLDQVAELVDRVRNAGVPVELTVTGDPVPVPAGVDLAAYRVVQEALTNTVKHAAGAGVSIVIDHAPLALRVEVTDTGGTRAPSAHPGNGRGLIGLQERLAVYGGTLETGKQTLGGYRVCAVIPKEAL
jgi:signal transduction histidine kinase